MEIIQVDRGDVRILRIVGAFDHGDVAALVAEVERAIDANRPRVVVDTEHLRFIASVGVGALLQARQRLWQHGGDLVLARPPELARKVIDVLGLEGVLPCADLDAAVERVASRDVAAADPFTRAGAVLFPSHARRPGDAVAEDAERSTTK